MKIFISAAMLCILSGTASAQQTAKAGHDRPSPAAMFQKIDLDNDGKISKDEASKSDRKRLHEKFDDIDANKDGFLDKAELMAFRRQMREQRGK